ncbi:MAG: hypothetical protein ACK4WH_06440 [Phycisphaerales bacterium]
MTIRILLATFLAGLSTAAHGHKPPTTHDEVAGKPALKAMASDLKATTVVATIEQPMPDGRNVLWCATAPLAWHELAEAMGGPLSAAAVGEGAAMVAALNKTASERADLDDASFVALGGFGRDGILKQIRDALQERFKGAASPSLLPPAIGPDEILAYSYLFKHLEFAEPLIRDERGLLFQGAKVASFGVWSNDRVENWGRIAGQVSIHRYESPTDWVVELKTKATDDRLIIARLDRKPTLGETVSAALASAASGKPESMKKADWLVVPLLNFDVTRVYGELGGVVLTGSKASGLVNTAIQNIRFRLDEKGAVLKSEMVFGVTAAPVVRQPRLMVCDGPFLIAMARAGAERPYFAAWIDNPELLVPFEKK